MKPPRVRNSPAAPGNVESSDDRLRARPKEGPPPAAVCVQLNRDITAAADGQGILALSHQHLHQFDIVNLVTALHRLARSSDMALSRDDVVLSEMV